MEAWDSSLREMLVEIVGYCIKGFSELIEARRGAWDRCKSDLPTASLEEVGRRDGPE